MKQIIEKIHNMNQADAYLLTSEENVSYATNFSGDSSEVLVTAKGTYFFTDFRYVELANIEVSDVHVVMTGGDERLSKINEYLIEYNIQTLGIEKSDVSLKLFEAYQQEFSIQSYVDVTGELLTMRMIKTEDELVKIKKAANANEVALQDTLSLIKPGISELDIRAELEYRMKKQGMDIAFPTIVAAGFHSAIPHATPTEYRIQSGDFLTIDFGCRYLGYCSDMTRTFGIGNIDGEQKKIYDIVKHAQESAALAATIGADTAYIDSIARDIIAENGYKEYYNHGTGHGVGRVIHELPVLNPRSSVFLEKNMVFTVEPGIYVAGTGGVRIEDMHICGQGNVYEFTKDLILL